MTSFFAAYDALCEEGTATTVCKALDEVADISVSGSVFKYSVLLLLKKYSLSHSSPFLSLSTLVAARESTLR